MKRNNKKWIWLSVIAVALVTAVVATLILLPRKPSEKVYVYGIDMVGMTDYMDYNGQSSGTVTADRVQSIYLSSTQTVTDVKVADGQQVKKGDVLFTYDTTLSNLALERKDLSIQQMELNLTALQSELKTINSYKPISYSGSTKPSTKPTTAPTTTSPQGTDLDQSPSSIGAAQFVSRGVGSGTTSKPLYYWMRSNASLDGFIEQELLKNATNAASDVVYVVFQMSKNNAASAQIVQEMGVVFEKEQLPTEPTPPPETDPTDPPSEPTDPSTEPTDPSDVTDPSQEPSTESTASEHSGSSNPAPTAKAPNGVEFTYRVASFFLPPDHSTAVTPTTPPSSSTGSGSNVNWNSGYTSTEIATMKAEKQAEIKELQFEIKMAKAEYNIMKKEADDGKVVSQFDGVVSGLQDPEFAFQNNVPLMKISGGGGFYVEGVVSELMLDTIQLGQQVSIYSWMTGTQCVGSVTEIGTYPAEDGYYGEGTASYYPYKVFVDETADLTEGDYVDMTFAQEEKGSAMYLQLPFVLTENNLSYVFVQGEDGLLEKRQIQTGANLWGSYVEVCSGVTQSDLIAFPYGKTVVEGAPTEQGDYDTLYNY